MQGDPHAEDLMDRARRHRCSLVLYLCHESLAADIDAPIAGGGRHVNTVTP